MDELARCNPEAYTAVLRAIRAAWTLVDNTGYHELLPLAINRDDWNDLALSMATLKALIPADELPAEPPHAVVCFWPVSSPPNDEAGMKPASPHQPPKPQST